MSPSRSLDGDGWSVKAYLGVELAERAARDGASASGPGWLPASVPGSVVHDLWRAGEVPDPYRERNTLACEWAAERAWLYRRRFAQAAGSPGDRTWLRFEGIDHAARIYLDGHQLGRHEGMFVPWEVEISDLLRSGGEHEVAVVVEPAPPSEPQGGRTSRVRAHKSRMGYGWDFCPRLIHQGIWRPVSLVTAGSVRIRDVWARPRLSPDLTRAAVGIGIELDSALEGRVRVEAALSAPPTSVDGSFQVPAGVSTVDLELEVDNPPLWWPNGEGVAVVGRLDVTAETGKGDRDERAVPIGFRHIDLKANEGAPAGARPWTFVVNGREIYARGWNWTPVDALYGAAPVARMEHLLRLAVDARVNLLRVWGGGLIETEAFYDACDRLGILVWQEFAQSSSLTDSKPASDRAFVQLMRREAEAIVPLRRNHPSLVAWCGGNELEDHAGPLDEERSPVLAALRDVVTRLDPARRWIPTSPSGPQFHNRLDVIERDPDGLHDVHGPWEHQGLHDHHVLYDRGTSLFNSEFGVEGMTNRRSHEALVAPEHRWPATRSNPVYRHLGDWWVNEPLVQAAFGRRIRDLEALRRASQWLQAEGLRYAVEANRRRAPRNSGSIPWQFNESYPNAWCTSAIDWGGDPKPAYYAVRRSYRTVHVCASFASPALDGRGALEARFWAWSERRAITDACLEVRLLDVDGRGLADPLTLGGGPIGSRPRELADATLQLVRAAGLAILDLRLLDEAGSGLPIANRYLLSTGADFGPLLDLAPATVELSIRQDGDRWSLELCHSSGPAALGLAIEDARPADAPGWANFGDNGFDLLPGERRTIELDWESAPREGRRLSIGGWNAGPLVVG